MKRRWSTLLMTMSFMLLFRVWRMGGVTLSLKSSFYIMIIRLLSKLNVKHAKRVEFLQPFNFSIKHKAGVLNQVTYALSTRHSLFSTMQITILDFDTFKKLNVDDSDFVRIWRMCLEEHFHDFMIQRVFFLKKIDCEFEFSKTFWSW